MIRIGALPRQLAGKSRGGGVLTLRQLATVVFAIITPDIGVVAFVVVAAASSSCPVMASSMVSPWRPCLLLQLVFLSIFLIMAWLYHTPSRSEAILGSALGDQVRPSLLLQLESLVLFLTMTLL